MTAEKPPRTKRIGKIVGLAALILLVFAIGRMSVRHAETEDVHEDGAPSVRAETWTCSMHPQVRQPEPGPCPICGMDLIPVMLDEDDDLEDDEVVRLRVSPRAAALMDIQTRPVERRTVEAELRLFGRVDYDESRIADIVLRSPGYIERLYANFTLQQIRKGDVLADIYSPDVVAAMRELLVTRDRGGETLVAAHARLVRMGVSTDQIDEVLRSGEVPRTYRITSPVDGVVKMVGEREGQWLREGGRLLQVADLSTVWIQLEAYETELASVATGQAVHFTAQAYPGEIFEGEVVYVDPVLNMRTRTVRFRAEVSNPDGRLKPGLFVRAGLHASATDDAAHAGHAMDDAVPLVIPASAPLITGKRAVVYVRIPDADRPTFEPRQVVLGPRAGNYYIVREGLDEGDLVVVNGQFKIDSELQIRGRPSMMQPEGGKPPVHDHGSMGDAYAGESDDVIEGVKVDDAFAEDIGRLIEINFELVEALAGDDEETARAAGEKGHALLVEIGRDELARLTESLEHFGHERDIERQRRLFETFSDALTDAVRKYGTGPVSPVYQAMCPMVEGRRGYWLQGDRTIRNPYFGEAMMRCGEIVKQVSHHE